MDGIISYRGDARATSDCGQTKEVKSMNLFTFDLQRFAAISGTWSGSNGTFTFEYTIDEETYSLEISGLADTVTAEQLNQNVLIAVEQGADNNPAVTIKSTTILTSGQTVSVSGNNATFADTAVTANGVSEANSLSGWGTYDSANQSRKYYANDSYTAGYHFVNDDSIIWQENDATELFTLRGITSTTKGISVSGNTVTVPSSRFASSEENATISLVNSVGNSYTLALSGTGVYTSAASAPIHSTANFGTVSNNEAIYTQTTTTEDYWNKTTTEATGETGSTETFTYTVPADTTTNLFKVTGISTTKGIEVTETDGTYNVTVPSTAFSSNAVGSSVSLEKLADTGTYDLALNGVTTSNPSKTTSDAWGTYTNGTFTPTNAPTGNAISYVRTTVTDDYWQSSASDDITIFTLTSTPNTYTELFKLEGVKSTAGITFSNDGKTVSVPQTAVADGVSSVSL